MPTKHNRPQFDWDGPVVDSELAKSASWYLAGKVLRGDLTSDLFEQLCCGDGTEHVRQMLAANGREFETIRNLAGLPRRATAERVRELLRLEAPAEVLEARRNEIRDALLDEPTLCNVAPGAKAFFNMAYAHKAEFGVVTNTTSPTVRRQIEQFELPHVFTHIEAVGDSNDAEIPPGLDAKATAFSRACRLFDASPAQTIAFDDSSAGAASAKAAGLTVVGVCQSRDKALAAADLHIYPDLGVLATAAVITALLNEPPAVVLAVIRDQGLGHWV